VNNHETACVPRMHKAYNKTGMYKLFSSHHVLERNIYKPKLKNSNTQ
jgi:hypothetical protein